MALLGVGCLAAWSALLLLPALRAVLFLAFFSMVLAAILSFPVGWAARLLPRWLAVLLTAVLLAGLLFGAGWLIAPHVAKEVRVLLQRLPTAIARLESWWRFVGERQYLPDGVLPDDPQHLLQKLQTELGRIALGVIPYAAGALAALGHMLAALVLAFFLIFRPRLYERGFISLVPVAHERATREVIEAMAGALGGWAAGILLSMTVVGILTAIGLKLLGVDIWLALAVIAFFGEFIPFLGPILAAVPGILAALALSPETAFWVALLYLAIQQIESTFIQPLAMHWAVRIAPGLLIVWQIAFATAFGLPGLLVSTPSWRPLQAGIQKGHIEKVLGKTAEPEPDVAAGRPDGSGAATQPQSRPGPRPVSRG
jgi:predicted PurR-regulated permease PerM